MIKIEYIDCPQDVYDITVADNENFFANGILVHNCAEISLPTVPMATVRNTRVQVPSSEVANAMKGFIDAGHKIASLTFDEAAETATFVYEEDLSRIALCTLSAINWGLIKKPSDFERPCRLAIRALDALLDYQDYPVEAARRHSMEWRPLGVGIINFAYFLAKHNVRYSDGSAHALVDEYAEAWSYYLIRASVDLAKEKGACLRSSDTKYGKGILPIDTYKREVDELVAPVTRMPWEDLRADLLKYGIRNSTTSAVMPAETSAQVANATNGIEPPRAYVSVKQSKDGVLKQVVPELRRLKNKYELLWDQRSPDGYLKLCAILQKYIDQTISTNTSYNPRFYPDEKIPMSEMLKHLLLCYKYGIKTLYYNNVNDQSGEMDVDKLLLATVDRKLVLKPQNAPATDIPVDESTENSCDSCVL